MAYSKMSLGRVLGKIPCHQMVIVRDYLVKNEYVNNTVNYVIDKILDYNQELRESEVYMISIVENVLIIDILVA